MEVLLITCSVLLIYLKISFGELHDNKCKSNTSKLQIFCLKDSECAYIYPYVHKEGLDVTTLYDHMPRLAARYRSPSPEIEHLVDFWVKQLTQSYNITDPWIYANDIASSQSLIGNSGEGLADILTAMRTKPIVRAGGDILGKNVKVMIKLEGYQKILFKPDTTDLWNFFFHSKEEYLLRTGLAAFPDKHSGEIAAFHLSLLLDIKTVPIATGRKISLSKEFLPVAVQSLAKTFSKKGKMTCFTGECTYCNPYAKICEKKGVLEGALLLWLSPEIELLKVSNPWARYRMKPNPYFTYDKDFCMKIRRDWFTESRFRELLDVIDCSVFDFIIQNMDRHQYFTFLKDSNSKQIYFDNGKSFENPYEDHFDILAPLLQCCRLRYSTYNRLLMFVGGGLSKAMRRLLSTDPLSPVVSDLHLKAMDRRLYFVLAAVEDCRQKHGNNIFF